MFLKKNFVKATFFLKLNCDLISRNTYFSNETKYFVFHNNTEWKSTTLQMEMAIFGDASLIISIATSEAAIEIIRLASPNVTSRAP